MKYECSLKEYKCKIPLFNCFVSDGETSRAETTVAFGIALIPMCVLYIIFCIWGTLNPISGLEKYVYLFYIAIFFCVIISFFLIYLFRKIVPKYCKIIDYMITIEILPNGINYSDNRSNDFVFIPKEKIISMYYCGDSFYGVDNNYVELATGVESSLSTASHCYRYNGDSLKDFFIPKSVETHYCYIIPNISDGGIKIPLELKKMFGIDISMGMH